MSSPYASTIDHNRDGSPQRKRKGTSTAHHITRSKRKQCTRDLVAAQVYQAVLAPTTIDGDHYGPSSVLPFIPDVPMGRPHDGYIPTTVGPPNNIDHSYWNSSREAHNSFQGNDVPMGQLHDGCKQPTTIGPPNN
eukprot:scaffold18416_cov63-Attheya_sp.AAC.4